MTARITEGIAAGAGGGALAFLATLVAGVPVAVACGAVAGGAGLVAGLRGVYEWRSVRGWGAWALDSTWGLVGTALGLLLTGANTVRRDSGYRPDLSRRRNRHVYERGFALQRGFAFTLGPVISNIATRGTIRPGLLERHESLHVWQARWFGPLYQALYAIWAPGGIVVATVTWLRHREDRWWQLVRTACYYDNPFEYWAYRRDERWPAGAHPRLAWKPRKGGRQAPPAGGAPGA
jgi:hypothetical protein